MRNFRIYGLCAVAATALLMAGCGGGSNTRPAAASSGSESSTPTTPATTTAQPIAAIPHTTGLAAAGSTTEAIEIPAGGSVTRGGVMFSCAGETACMISLTVTDDGDVSGTSTGGTVTAMFVDPLVNMNPTNAASVAAIMGSALDTVAVADDDQTVVGGASTAAVIGGLKDGGMIDGFPAGTGIGAADMSKVSVTDMLDPNSAVVSTVTAAVDMDENTDDIGMYTAGAVGLAGWGHRVLHSDWGDTRTPDRDGGFETIAVVYSNLQGPGPVAFADVATTLANGTITFDEIEYTNVRAWFTLTDGVVVGIDTSSADNWLVPAMTITILVEDSLVADITQVKAVGSQVQGTYFGAKGTFTCTTATANGTCTIRRAMAGDTDFRVADLNGEDAGYGAAGTWSFEPDEGVMVMLPDQDWLAFGFWLTAPDDAANGLHRLGVFHDGMDMYAFSEDGDDAGKGLDGSATYDGAAAGYYVNGEESGLFTANAYLMADFGHGNANGMLSGRVDNFKNSRGAFIGTDTRANPNDPLAGGESDWVVTLRETEIIDDGGFRADGGFIRGSADGVQWADGEWDAQFYGGGDRAVDSDADPVVPADAPSGVGGTFRAITDELSTGGFKGVIGAFGAELDVHTPEPPAEGGPVAR